MTTATDMTISNMINASPYYRARAVAALNETKALLAKEMTYSADLRKPEYVTSLEEHIKYLEGML